MFKSKTLFIVGAGASAEVGLPVGRELLESVAKALNIRFSKGYDLSSGDYAIHQALARHAKRQSEDENEYYRSGRTITDALPIVPSIDNFLDARKDDKRIQLCGKLGIARKILDAERRSKLYAGDDGRKEILSTIANTWYAELARLLVQGADRTNVGNYFDNISFVTFNYDRCIEQFFFHALQKYYSLDQVEVLSVLQKLKVLRPYGSVGQLPWQIRGDASSVKFGADVEASDLLSAANRIRTFTERVEDEASLAVIRNEVAQARTVVFLGFGFLRQNMELLAVSGPSYAQRVFATTFGFSAYNRPVIEKDISLLLKKSSENISIELLAPHLRCAELFSEYSLGLVR